MAKTPAKSKTAAKSKAVAKAPAKKKAAASAKASTGRNIALIYKDGSIPDIIVKAAKQQAPKGFSLSVCKGSEPDDKRRKIVAVSDYIITYGLAFNDLDVAQPLKLLQLLSAGFDRLDLTAFAKAGVPVANNGGANGPTVAEHTLMLILSVFKKLPLHHNALSGGKWLGHQEALRMRELRGKQVGIVGFGKIGQDVARMANGFLATVAYFDVNRAAPAVEKELKAKRMTLDKLIETSDIITVHTPLNKATRGLFGAKQFAKMKKSAIFINTARGEVMDQKALICALDKGQIAGAGLDVFIPEPVGPGSPLFGRDNVVVTPHIAGTTIDTWTRRMEVAFENVLRVSKGKGPLPVSLVQG
jgi:phosphoglycerate dehydrogenase-like enzyme